MQHAVYRMAAAMEQCAQKSAGVIPPEYLKELHTTYGSLLRDRENPPTPRSIHRGYMQDIMVHYVETKEQPPSNLDVIVIWAALSNPSIRRADINYFMDFLIPLRQRTA
jgi:hypothetical protein